MPLLRLDAVGGLTRLDLRKVSLIGNDALGGEDVFGQRELLAVEEVRMEVRRCLLRGRCLSSGGTLRCRRICDSSWRMRSR